MITSLLLAAVLLVPVVLLLAFAGCGQIVDTSAPQPEGPPPGTGPITGTIPPPPPPPDYRATILAEVGLAAYWRLAETAGTGARDSGPLARDGVYRSGVELGRPGALVARQPEDTAVAFDGASGLVEIAVGTAAGVSPEADPLVPKLSFSVEAWVNLAPDPAGGANRGEVVFDAAELPGDGTIHGFSLFVARQSDPPSLHGVVGTGVAGTPDELVDEVRIGLPQAVLEGTWFHVVLTYDGSAGGRGLNLHLNYVDPASGKPARLKQTTPNVPYLPTRTQPLLIGAGQDAAGRPANFLTGRLDEVALYNVVLPDPSIGAHFALSHG